MPLVCCLELPEQERAWCLDFAKKWWNMQTETKSFQNTNFPAWCHKGDYDISNDGWSIQYIGSKCILQNTVLIGITTNCGQTSLTVTRMCKIHVYRFRSPSFHINLFFPTFKQHSKCNWQLFTCEESKNEVSSGNQGFYSFVKWNEENFWSKESSNYWSII